jgi:hypothetical protein
MVEGFFVKLHGAPVGSCGRVCFKNCRNTLDEEWKVRILYMHMCTKSHVHRICSLPNNSEIGLFANRSSGLIWINPPSSSLGDFYTKTPTTFKALLISPCSVQKIIIKSSKLPKSIINSSNLIKMQTNFPLNPHEEICTMNLTKCQFHLVILYKISWIQSLFELITNIHAYPNIETWHAYSSAVQWLA